MRRAVAILLAAVAWSTGADAQALQPELRLDVIGPAPASIEPGIGATARVGHYLRVGWAAGYDVASHDRTFGTGHRWRGEVIGRVTLDPFREHRWGLSFGGGITYRRSRAYLAAIVDLEGPELRGLLPAVQLGVSGGMRGGVILRRAIRGRR